MTYVEGEAPWPEDEQFEEQAKACRSRCRKYGYVCDGSEDAVAEYEGQCTECQYDALEMLEAKYASRAAAIRAAGEK